MATVDLEMLSAELTAAGYHVTGPTCSDEGEYTILVFDYQTLDPILSINQIGFVAVEHRVWNVADHWPALDIIRRHVAPVAPDPGLRVAIAKALALTMPTKPYGYDEVERVTNAVLAVLAERGVR